MLDIVERLYNDTPNVHDSVEAGSEIQRLRDENKAQHEEIERLKRDLDDNKYSHHNLKDSYVALSYKHEMVERERDEAYERAAQVCEEMVVKPITPANYIAREQIANAIRALKTKP